ncbi:Gfo/Idh/MocA family oxidoreductase [Oceanobacillus caeni]|uniref:Gfo/Idh/MocA family protein n=1 Tax=Oceanobacillus caeni TaxID=405946 RepID=UPI0019590311|nr:Gfo/Idh/MocA family oxidoreductase [Oceanobacillus caeni]MCR1832846.1 Gfo/Idh/MocA family oxidoreductase [Oceanobacillus caeni]
MSKVKVGILGAGGIAQTHVDNLKNDTRVDIIGIADIKQEHAENLAKQTEHAKPVGSLLELLELGVDAVYVTIPNTLHVDAVLTCLENNVNVFSEKPMATNLADAKKIKDAAAKSDAIYNLGMNQRYAHVFKKVKGLIEKGELHPYVAHMKLNRGELLNPAWTSNPEITGGFFFETPIHLLDLSRYLFGEAVTVTCEARQSISESELDSFTILLTYESGTIATFVTYAHSGWSFPFESLEVYGKHSTITTKDLDHVMYSPGLNQKIEVEEYFDVSFADKWGYVEEDRLFIDSLVNGSKQPVSAEDGYQTAKLIDAIYESAKTGEKITLSEYKKELETV